MKIRRSMVVLFIIAMLVIPISLYRSIFSENASEEFVSTVNIINNVLITVFVMLVVAFSIFSDDYPHTYTPGKTKTLGIISVLAAAACGYSSILGLISSEDPLYTGAGGIFFSVLGLFAVLSMMFYSITFFKGENLILSFPLIPAIPALWYGYRMLAAFLKSASMADISAELPIIAMCCAFTVFMLTMGKLFCCINSNSIKWGFAAGCIGIMTSLLYCANWLVTQCHSFEDLISNPLIFTDVFMALFAIGTLFHVSKPAQYFDDEEWDDYFYETYDLPKPNLILHTPVDELEEDSLLDDDINESPYIPVTSSVGSARDEKSGSAYSGLQPSDADTVPSYIANPSAYYAQQYQRTPVHQQPSYYPQASYPSPYQAAYPTPYPASYPQSYPTSYPAYPPVYPYQGVVPPNAGYSGYPMSQQPVQYVAPYDEAAAQYQYERRRAELQNRELEKLTGEVDSSIARLQNNVNRSQPPSNQYVNASPDEKLDHASEESHPGRSVRLAPGYAGSGERLTDHVNRLEQKSHQENETANDGEDEYTYEYYYPNNRSRYNLNQFNPTDGSSSSQSGSRQ